jgi:dienelactone hydrolase
VSGWTLGVNRGPSSQTVDRLMRLVDQLVSEQHRRVSVVGWSLGGVFAVGVARRVPKDIRQVITLGSPVAGAPEAPPHVPVTSIYSKTDGIVPWRYSILPRVPLRESIEVRGSHLGLGHNPAVLSIVAERLAQPDGQWRPTSAR